MLQVAIIGMGTFGVRMLEELNEIDAEVIIVDKDQEVIDTYKDLVRDAYITDAINQAALEKVVPHDIDAAIIDLSGALEVSIMATVFLKKMEVKNIIVKARSDEHGEILKLLGATKVIFPDLDAAQRLTPLLASSVLFNYMQISPDLALAEVGVLVSWNEKTLAEANMRAEYGLNVVAYREAPTEPFTFIANINFQFSLSNILLVAGTEEAIRSYADQEERDIKTGKKRLIKRLFK
ncbi:MAG: TrkA family potassium uptake protein [Spirochaetales bacterium]